MWGFELDSFGLGEGPVVGYCEHDNNEHLSSIKSRVWVKSASQQGLCFTDLV